MEPPVAEKDTNLPDRYPERRVLVSLIDFLTKVASDFTDSVCSAVALGIARAVYIIAFVHETDGTL
jgi:hypothetical protein